MQKYQEGAKKNFFLRNKKKIDTKDTSQIIPCICVEAAIRKIKKKKEKK